MFSTAQIRSLITALTGLITLVVLSLVLLFTSAFLWPEETPGPVNTDWEGHNRPRIMPKPTPLSQEQLHGKTLFENNCAQCHALTLETLVGPGLSGVKTRTPSEAWLLSWIRNSQSVVASGDPYAVALYDKFNRVAMPGFTMLTNADIKAILSYVDSVRPTVTNVSAR